jgi:hypothetical protein
MKLNHITKKQWEQWYFNENKSTYDIGTMLGCDPCAVLYWFKKHGIKSRPRVSRGSKLSESHRQKISKSNLGRTNINPETGIAYHDKRVFVECTGKGNPSCTGSKLVQQWELKKKKDHFCCNKCHNEWLKLRPRELAYNFKNDVIEIKCAWDNCENICRRKQSERKCRNYKNAYCCREHEVLWKSKYKIGDKVYNFKGDSDYKYNYGPGWDYTAEQIRNRDGRCCRNCDKTEQQERKLLSVHHIVPFRLFGLKNYQIANVESNLITLCNDCHIYFENNVTSKIWDSKEFKDEDVMNKLSHGEGFDVTYNPKKSFKIQFPISYNKVLC